MHEEVKKNISDAKNICLIPSENEPESLTAALALFYTLRELNKNVNLIIEDFPEKFNFLAPSLDSISSPKNFVISIPRDIADVSQIYYEKNEENLKIHLTIDKGKIKKENISFYFSEPKPDLIITLGIDDLQSQLSGRLDSFGFILDVPILNIDSEESSFAKAPEGQRNKKFGQINLIEDKSISEITFDIIKSIDENPDGRAIEGPRQSRDLIKKDAANCLLAGLLIYYENFKSAKMGPEIFSSAAELIKKGASHEQIVNNLYKVNEKEINFFSKIFQTLKIDNVKMSYAILDSGEFQNFTETEATFAVEKIKTLGLQKDLLVLWQSHASNPIIKGFFYSKKPALINKIAQNHSLDKFKISVTKKDWVFLSILDSDINLAKEKILNMVSS